MIVASIQGVAQPFARGVKHFSNIPVTKNTSQQVGNLSKEPKKQELYKSNQISTF